MLRSLIRKHQMGPGIKRNYYNEQNLHNPEVANLKIWAKQESNATKLISWDGRL